MKMMIAFVLSTAVAALVLTVNPELRQHAAEVLFNGAGEAAEATADVQPADHTQQTMDKVAGMLSQMGKDAMKAVAHTVKDSAPQHVAAETTEPEGASVAPEQPANTMARPTAEATPPAQRVKLPQFLSGARFGMSVDEVKAAFQIAWTKQEGGELTLTHYPVPDKSQMVKFGFRDGRLRRVEIALKAAEGQDLKEFYDRYQQTLAEQYRQCQLARRTRWSDGHVRASIALNGQLRAVEITYAVD